MAVQAVYKQNRRQTTFVESIQRKLRMFLKNNIVIMKRFIRFSNTGLNFISINLLREGLENNVI